MTGEVVIFPVVRVESAGLRVQEDERAAMLVAGRPPSKDEVRASAERAKRKKADEVKP